MTRSIISTNALPSRLAAIAVFVVFSTSAMAQVEQHSQISVQGTALATKDSTADFKPISNRVTSSGGLLVGYSYQFNSWAGAEGNYGYTQNAQDYTGLSEESVRSNFHEFTGAFVAHIPIRLLSVRPYALAGAGALVFDPTSDATMHSDVNRQTKAAFVYGGGANFNLTHNFGVRAEYRGLVYKAPDFSLPNLNSESWTHTAQPSAGIVLRF